MALSLGKTNFRQVCSVLRLVYREPLANRKMIGDSLGLDRAMVTHIYNYLVEHGWLISQESSLKRLPLVLNKNRIFSLGVEVQPEYQVFVVSNLKGEIVLEETYTHKITDPLEFLQNTIIPFIKNLDVEVAGVALGLPGIVNSSNNKLVRSVPFLFSSEVTFPDEIEINDKKIPVYIENDVRCCGWEKVAFQKEYTPFFFYTQHFLDDQDDPLKLGRITNGGAFFFEGKPFTGGNGCAGEMPGIFRIPDFSKMHVTEDERSLMKIEKGFQEKHLKNTALTLAYLSNVFDVSKVYLNGFEHMDLDFLQTKISEYASQYRFYPDLQKLNLVIETNNSIKTALGAAGLVFEELIVRPCEGEISDSVLFEKK